MLCGTSEIRAFRYLSWKGRYDRSHHMFNVDCGFSLSFAKKVNEKVSPQRETLNYNSILA